MVEVIAQHVKPIKVPSRYPCIIYSNFEHWAPNCLKKAKVQNMFRIKPTATANVVAKNPKLYNVPFNVVIAITTHNKVPK